MSPDALHDHPVELLRALLRFDTSNPPGNERECIGWIKGLLEELGCEVRILAREPERPSLITRLPGRGASVPLLLQGHVDVVAARGEWQHEPFAGDLADGYVWGRGALDMKGGVAMMLAAFMRAKASGAEPPGDVIPCLLADEEAGSPLGAEFVVREHPELFAGVRYSSGEFDPLLHNTVSATVVGGGEKVNVIPDSITLSPELPFMQLIHAENERLPADAVEFGTTAIGRVLERF